METTWFTKSVLFKFVKFCIVGFTGMAIDFGLTYLFREKIKVQQYVANAIGFIAAASYNYYLNRIWTFHSNNPDVAIEYSMFIFISVIGLLINTAVLWLFTERVKWNFYVSKFIAIGVTTIWNFGANFLYTFAS